MSKPTKYSKLENSDPVYKQMEQLAQDALAAVTGPRQQDYGGKLRNFTQIAIGFEMILARKLLPGATITAHDVSLLMLQVKLARLAHMPEHADSLVDTVGYALCRAGMAAEAGDIKSAPLDKLDREAEFRVR